MASLKRWLDKLVMALFEWCGCPIDRDAAERMTVLRLRLGVLAARIETAVTGTDAGWRSVWNAGKGRVMDAELDRLTQSVRNMEAAVDRAVPILEGASTDRVALASIRAALIPLADAVDAKTARLNAATETATPPAA